MEGRATVLRTLIGMSNRFNFNDYRVAMANIQSLSKCPNIPNVAGLIDVFHGKTQMIIRLRPGDLGHPTTGEHLFKS